MTDAKVAALRQSFAPLIGARLSGYETAELRIDGGAWAPWRDMPIRLQWDAGSVVSVSWSGFDDLRVTPDVSLPIDVEPLDVRWVSRGVPDVDRVLGATLRSVALGRGEMTIEGHDIEVWTRVVLATSAGWLEIYDDLDQNGYAFSAVQPAGTLLRCA